MLLVLFRQSLHEVTDGLGHLLHSNVAAADGLVEQQPETGDDGHEQQDKDEDEQFHSFTFL